MGRRPWVDVAERGVWSGTFGAARRCLALGFFGAMALIVPVSGASGQEWRPVSADHWTDGSGADGGGAERSFVWRAPDRGRPAFEVVRGLVRGAESGAKGYDAIHHSARRLPGKRPTEMTLAEIVAWIDATPGQHHAIGLYQIIPSTLRRLMRQYGIASSVRFTAATQDALGRVLMEEAGLSEFETGGKSVAAFADKLARVWAGFPLASGRSAYHGIAGNRATMTRSDFEAALGAIKRGRKTPVEAGWREVSAWR